jgi:hypothetical protein
VVVQRRREMERLAGAQFKVRVIATQIWVSLCRPGLVTLTWWRTCA